MNNHSDRPVPSVEQHGKFVAWNHDGTEVIASGDCFAEVKQKALESGEPRPRFEKIPRADAKFIGSTL